MVRKRAPWNIVGVIRTFDAFADPNGPFYDELHGVWHLFYQDHLAKPAGGHGSGPVWAHAASHDLAHWTKLPIALW